jgi:D-alanyl-D-alanine dipeptidase
MDSVNGSSGTAGTSGTHDSQSASLGAQSTPTQAETQEQELRDALAENPQAVAALSALTANTHYAQLSVEQQVQALTAFNAAPNLATATYLQGVAEQTLNPQATPTALTPDAGTLTLDGQTYSIQNGNLIGADGQVAGTIRNDGQVQLNSETTTRSVYDDINTRVQLRETNAAQELQDLVNLHAADPNARLDNVNINREMARLATDVISRARMEGMDMRVVSDFRSVEEQNALFAQGRTAPGRVVTNATGGSSWHNYGLAVDVAFNNANGQPSWPENANWDRYGEIAVQRGLEWGGNWRGINDRPHIEYHPGLGAGEARTMLPAYRQGGLDQVWNNLGLGGR